jgi:L-iditol 2-dehydrogenase
LCAGGGGGWGFASQPAPRPGRYVQVGLAGKPVAIPFDEVCYRELVVTGGNASTPASWRRALALVEARTVDLAALVSGAFPLSQWEQAFAATRAGDGIKLLLEPR